MGRLSRGWELTKLSFKVIGDNKSLMVFPLLSGIAIMLVLSTFAVGFWFFPDAFVGMHPAMWFVMGFLTYIILFFISFYFQAALIACAYEALEGKHPTVGFGLKRASSRAASIFAFAVISATVGMILQALAQRAGVLGRIVIRLVGAAWSIATYFTVPIIVMEGEGAWAGVKKSWRVLSASWGEAFVGHLATRLIFFLLSLPFFLFLVLGFYIGTLSAIVTLLIIGVIYLAFIALLGAAVNGVLQTALYRYATTGQIGITLPNWIGAPQGYSPDTVAPPGY